MATYKTPPGLRKRKWIGLLGRGLLGLILAACIVQTARDTIATWLGARGTVSGIRGAERWDGSNPDFPAQLGRALAAQDTDVDPGEVSRAFRDATQLGPHRAENWASLGEALDLEGNIPAATSAYEKALELFPQSPEINWEYANFLVRSGVAEKAIPLLRSAIGGDPSLRDGAFDLAWRTGIPREHILKALPAREDVFSAYLDYLSSTGRIDAAADAWNRLLDMPDAINLDSAFRYFDALLRAHRVEALAPMWAELARHDSDRIQWQQHGDNPISNGGFEESPLNGGFDWRIAPIEGAEVSVDSHIAHSGSRSLLVHFEGKYNLDFSHVVKYVPVQRDTSYRFTAYMRTEEITTDQGPRIAIYDAFDRALLSLETENLTGTTAWQEQRLDFRTGPGTDLLVVQILRPPSHKLDNQIAGTVWFDDFSLTAIP